MELYASRKPLQYSEYVSLLSEFMLFSKSITIPFNVFSCTIISLFILILTNLSYYLPIISFNKAYKADHLALSVSANQLSIPKIFSDSHNFMYASLSLATINSIISCFSTLINLSTCIVVSYDGYYLPFRLVTN